MDDQELRDAAERTLHQRLREQKEMDCPGCANVLDEVIADLRNIIAMVDESRSAANQSNAEGETGDTSA